MFRVRLRPPDSERERGLFRGDGPGGDLRALRETRTRTDVRDSESSGRPAEPASRPLPRGADARPAGRGHARAGRSRDSDPPRPGHGLITARPPTTPLSSLRKWSNDSDPMDPGKKKIKPCCRARPGRPHAADSEAFRRRPRTQVQRRGSRPGSRIGRARATRPGPAIPGTPAAGRPPPPPPPPAPPRTPGRPRRGPRQRPAAAGRRRGGRRRARPARPGMTKRLGAGAG
jgi:hypothetical protein